MQVLAERSAEAYWRVSAIAASKKSRRRRLRDLLLYLRSRLSLAASLDGRDQPLAA